MDVYISSVHTGTFRVEGKHNTLPTRMPALANTFLTKRTTGYQAPPSPVPGKLMLLFNNGCLCIVQSMHSLEIVS